MTKEAIIQRTVAALKTLPEDKAKEIFDFAEFILQKYEEVTLQEGLTQLQSESEALSFLNEDEPLYSIADIKEKF